MKPEITIDNTCDFLSELTGDCQCDEDFLCTSCRAEELLEEMIKVKKYVVNLPQTSSDGLGVERFRSDDPKRPSGDPSAGQTPRLESPGKRSGEPRG